MTDLACRIYEDVLIEHGGDANAALLALAARYAAIAGSVSRGFLRRPMPPEKLHEQRATGEARERSKVRQTPPGLQKTL